MASKNVNIDVRVGEWSTSFSHLYNFGSEPTEKDFERLTQNISSNIKEAFENDFSVLEVDRKFTIKARMGEHTGLVSDVHKVAPDYCYQYMDFAKLIAMINYYLYGNILDGECTKKVVLEVTVESPQGKIEKKIEENVKLPEGEESEIFKTYIMEGMVLCLELLTKLN
jgi:hypothetical protein